MTASAPASPGQERHWRFQRAHPDSPAFNMTMALHLSGAVDVTALRTALRWVLDRHEALRARFAERDGALEQRFVPASDVPWRTVDLPEVAPAERLERLREAGGLEATRPFDLANEPVTRLLLVRLDADEHVLVVNVHHIAFDGWSAALLLDELAVCYPAAAAGEADPLSAPPVPFGEHARRQRTLLTDPRTAEHLDYWRERLADPPPALRWPAAPPAWRERHARGEVYWGLVDPAAVAGTGRLARDLRVTPFMVYLAAYLALLRSWTGQEDLCVGVPLAARRSADSEQVLGFFVNTVVIRADLSGGPAFDTLVRDVRGALLAAHRHQDVPYGAVLDRLAPPVEPYRSPLFQTMFILQNEMRRPRPWGPVTVRQTMLATGHAKYDLTVSLESREETLAVDAEYRPACLDAEGARRLLGTYASLLRHAQADPSARADDLVARAAAEPACLTPPPTAATPALELFRGPIADWRPGVPTVRGRA